MKLLGISGTLVGSKPAILVGTLLQYVQAHQPDVDIEFIDARHYDLNFCDGRPTETYNDDTQAFIQKVIDVDAFIIGTTILHGAMPGVLKNIFELVPISTFANKSVLFAASGGNQQHYLAVESSIKPVANYLNMYVFPQYAFVLSSQFTEQNTVSAEVDSQLQALTKHFSQYMVSLKNVKEEVV